MNNDPPGDRPPKPKNPSRRAFFAGWLNTLTDRDKMGEIGAQAGRAVREAKEAMHELDAASQEVQQVVDEAVQQVRDALDPPMIPPSQAAAFERRIAHLEDHFTALQTQAAQSTEEIQALLHEIVECVKQPDEVVSILRQSSSPRDQAEAERWRGLRQTLWALLAAAGGALASKTAEALYEGWVQENLWPLLPKWVRRPWQTAVSAQESQPTSPLSSPLPTPTQPESPLAQPTRQSRAHLPEMVYIPAGWFLMGSDRRRDPLADKFETPQHWLYLPSYRISRTPVTVAHFAAFVDATGYRTRPEKENWGYSWRHPYGRESDISRKQDHPVTVVAWRDAQAFCDWAGVRLPTEAEWEKAARGSDGRIYPWGDAPPTDKLCNFGEDFGENVNDTTPVGNYPAGASPYGCLDMAGNVWEWTSTRWGGYPYDPTDGREDLTAPDSVLRVIRGGSWNSDMRWVRCAARYGDFDLRVNRGFRVVSPGF